MLNYRIHGEPNSTTLPLVVQHGLFGSSDNWNTFAAKQKTKRPVIALDMRNHGDSPHVEGMSYSKMAEDVLEVLDHLDLPVVDLMGHSMGGKVAMLLALNQPQRINNLIIVDIAPVNYPPKFNALLKAMLSMPLADFKNRREADNWLAPLVSNAFERAFLLKNLTWDSNKKLTWQCNLQEIARHYLSITHFPAIDRIYSGNTLFISGGKSDYVTPDGWQVALKYFPAAQHIRIEEAGHLPHVQTAEVFISHVNDFLD